VLNLKNQIWNLGRGDLPERSPAVRLAHDMVLAVAAVGLAFLIRYGLGVFGPKVLIFAVCYPILLLVTLISGLRAGIFSLILSTLVFWYVFIPEYYSFDVPSLVDGLNVALYAVAGLAIIWISEQYRRTYERLLAERARSELLLREMHHRSKNNLAVVSSIVSQSLKHNPHEARRINERLTALRQGEEVLWSEITSISIEELLRGALSSYDQARLTLSGEELNVSGELAKSLILIIHELATNAVKYGAWSSADGVVCVSWGKGPIGKFLKWTETGGPRPVVNAKPGFGTFLIGRLLRQHHGAIETSFPATGLVAAISFRSSETTGQANARV
jgi:two-component sensor histidine kinase